jgi:cytochrome d ubiquinol oxidase subunit I
MRKGGTPTNAKWFLPAMISMPFLPLLSNSFGWIFTETARQPWVVFGLFKTANGVSPTVTAGEVLFTMIVFTALYGILAVIEFKLFIRAIRVGPEKVSAAKAESDQVLTMAY